MKHPAHLLSGLPQSHQRGSTASFPFCVAPTAPRLGPARGSPAGRLSPALFVLTAQSGPCTPVLFTRLSGPTHTCQMTSSVTNPATSATLQLTPLETSLQLHLVHLQGAVQTAPHRGAPVVLPHPLRHFTLPDSVPTLDTHHHLPPSPHNFILQQAPTHGTSYHITTLFLVVVFLQLEG